MESKKIGILQFDIKTGRTEYNTNTAITGIRELSAKGAEVVILPEMFSCSFDYKQLASHSLKTPGIIKRLQHTARENNVIIAGSMPELEGEKIFNTLYLIERNGEIAGEYRKIHLFSLTEEHHHFAFGNKAVVCKTSAGIIGLMICYDLRFPELCRRLTDNGAELVIISAQWPTPRIEHWDTLAKARAIENQVYVAAANRIGSTDLLDFPGHSQIISPWGEVLAKADTGHSLILAEISPDEIKKTREAIPCLKERVHAAYS